MNRIVCGLLAAGAVTLALIPSAHASPACPQPSPDRAGYSWRHPDSDAYRFRDHRWRALYRARRTFYRHWRGDRWERVRFERWYARRCAELRQRGW